MSALQLRTRKFSVKKLCCEKDNLNLLSKKPAKCGLHFFFLGCWRRNEVGT